MGNPNNSCDSQADVKHIELGNLYLEEKRYNLALEEFNKVLKNDPCNEYAYVGLGHIYLQQRHYDLALEAFNNGLRINSKNPFIHQGLGAIYLEQGLHDMAQAEFEETLMLGDDNIFVHRMLGYLYKRKCKDDLATAEFIKTTDLYLAKEKVNKQSADKKGMGPVLILRMPSFCSKDEIYSTELNTSLLPPLALGQITAYLRANGVRIDQDDLNIKIHYDNYYSGMVDKEIDISVFSDEARIVRYISGAEDKDLESVMEKVEKKSKFDRYNIILLSLPMISSNPSSLMFTLSLSMFIKKKYKPIFILGGISQSIDLLIKYDSKDMDFIIYGDGEVVLLKLLTALKNETDLTEILGSKVKGNSRVIIGEDRPSLKPDFSGLPMDKYRYIGLNSSYNDGTQEILEEFNKSGTMLLPFRLIKGCPYECIFCASSLNKSIYVLDPVRAALYLKELQEEYNPTGFFFLSDTINISKLYINELCDEMIKNKTKILWSDCARADNLDRDTLFKMRKAGCIRLIFGMETASQMLMRAIDKKVSLKRLENILRWSDEAGIWTGIEIISGLPHERDSDIEETIAYLNRNRGYINALYINQFDLRDNSILLQNAEKYGIENIAELNQYADGEFTFFHKYGYGETDGLRWEDKKKQILASYKKVINSTVGNTVFPVYELEHFLFYLYSRFGNKPEICNIFAAVEKEKESLLKKILNNGKSSG